MGGGDPGPGSSQLIGLIEKAGGELLADFEQYTRYHFLDLLVDGSGLTPRLALELIRQLPAGSRTIAMLRGGPEFLGWDADRYMMANIFDAIQANTYVTLAAASGKRKPKKPKPIERPESRVNKKRGPNSFAAIAMAKMANSKKRK